MKAKKDPIEAGIAAEFQSPLMETTFERKVSDAEFMNNLTFQSPLMETTFESLSFSQGSLHISRLRFNLL